MSIDPAVFVGLTIVTYKQTDTQTDRQTDHVTQSFKSNRSTSHVGNDVTYL